MPFRSVTDYVFPVLAGTVGHQKGLRVLKAQQIFGTAFSIGRSWFVTAAHVLASADAHGEIAVARLAADGVWDFAIAEAVYREDSLDIAFFRAPLSEVKEHFWRGDVLPMFADVSAVGFPFGMDPDRAHIDARGFRGTLVTSTQFSRLARMPDIYEVSFSAPLGLSGAPLMCGDAVAGIVIGNRSTEMLVFAHREILRGDKELVTERFEAMQLGTAVQTTNALALRHDDWGGSLESHLVQQRLLVEFPR